MSAAESDFRLLQRFSMEGDEQAFAQIVQRHAAMVFGAGYRILADRARAEEVAQEAFLRLARRPWSVTHSVAGWLHRAATQVALDVYRSDSARRRRETEFVFHNPPPRPRQIHEALHWAEISPIIDAALAELSESDRSLLVEHFLEGRTQQAIAAERKVSTATLCRQVKAALEKLRAHLGRRGVWAAGGALGLWMTHHAPAEASAGLLAELGKLSMISPDARQAPPPQPAHAWRDTLAAARRMAPVIFQVLLLLSLLIFLMIPIVRAWVGEDPPPAPLHDTPHEGRNGN